MKLSKLILFSFSILLFSCGGDKPKTSLDDKFDGEKYFTHLYTLDKKENKALFDGVDRYDIQTMFKDSPEMMDEFKPLTYSEAIPKISKVFKEWESGKAEREVNKLKDQFKREIESTKKFDGSAFRGTVVNIQLEVAIFEVWKGLIKEAKGTKDKELNDLRNQLINGAKKVQKKEFPKLRQDYAKVANELMWENNIEVSASGGKQYTTLTFIGGAFANNKNIKDVQTSVSDIVDMLRFKRVNYKWIKHEEEYTYYDIKSKKDDAI